MSSTQNILITGANRGLGLGFVKHYLAQDCQVWATYRGHSTALEALNNPNCHPIQWDVTQAISANERAKLPNCINLLINNAGIYGSAQNLTDIKPDEMLNVFNINAISPITVVQTLLPALKKGRATIANMSSKMGSVSDNDSGGVYAYRAAKSALCNISKSMAVDLASDHIRVICLHPGWVKTDMTNDTGLIDVSTSVAGLSAVIENINDYSLGAFVAYDGAVVPY